MGGCIPNFTCNFTRLALAFACLIAIGCSNKQDTSVDASSDAKPEINAQFPVRLAAEHLPNAIRIHERVISGGQPVGDSAFEELRALGIKTIISVDGAKPDIALSEKYGMRYVHLPHGYNGIAAARVAELAKAVRDFEGPIYVHCHHGKHRSPTAAVVACVSNGMLDPMAATGVLKFAGTNENYQGLYQSAAIARRIDNQILDALEAEFPQTAKLPPLAEAMVELEHTHDHLKRLAAADWKTLDDHPDLDPAHEALLLSEHFTEMLRMESVASQPAEFRAMLERSESGARELEKLLRNRQSKSSIGSADVKAPFERISADCAVCHKRFRDVPIGQ